MKLSDQLWKGYELDLQEVKIAYLNWALDQAKEPSPRHRHLFLWGDQERFGLVNSRYGRAFSISPFGIGVRGVPSPRIEGEPLGTDNVDMELKERLSSNTNKIRQAIRYSLMEGEIEHARDAVLTFYWLKLGTHELLFDRIRDERLDESDNKTLPGIRNRIINCIRFGENLEDAYVQNLNKRLPGLSGKSLSTFLSSAMTWNKYAMCAFDCGPVLWSKNGFTHFHQVKERMNKLGWPHRSTVREVLKPFYRIALDYQKPPIRMKNEADNGYSLKSMRKRRCQLYEILDNILNEIQGIRDENITYYT